MILVIRLVVARFLPVAARYLPDGNCDAQAGEETQEAADDGCSAMEFPIRATHRMLPRPTTR